MRQLFQLKLLWTALAASYFVIQLDGAAAQNKIRRLPPIQIAIDEDILAEFVDEPCRNFEAANDAFAHGENSQAAQHLRVAMAFLRLESARATADGKTALDASVLELQRLAVAVEDNQVRTVDVLQQAFARAHFALAGHHCIKSAHRCCQPSAFHDKQEMNRMGRDLNAAAIHLERGTLWAGSGLDEETQKALDATQFSAERLQVGEAPQSEVVHAIRSVRDRLEKVTGRKIMLAPAVAGDDKLGPSIFR